MASLRSLSATLWLSTLALVLLLSVDGVRAKSLASVTATRPKPIVLTTAKPKPSKPDAPDLSGGGGGGSTTTSPSAPNGGGSTTTNANNYVFLPCTTVDVALVMNPGDLDVQQCMAFSTYNFGSGWLPTTLQRSLLCDTGCWNMIDRLQMTPIPYCSVVLGGRAVNYIDALYTVFADCVADSTNAEAVASPTTAPMATDPPTSGSVAWRTSVLSLAVSAMVLVLMV